MREESKDQKFTSKQLQL